MKFSIFDNVTREMVSDRLYSTAEEASHDYYMNAGHTHVGIASSQPKARVTVQIFKNGEFSEIVATSEVKTAQEMVDWMAENANPGILLTFLGEHGFIKPSRKEIEPYNRDTDSDALPCLSEACDRVACNECTDVDGNCCDCPCHAH